MVLNKLPPGPLSLPLIGNLGVFTGITSKTLVNWSKKYGPIFGLQLGSSPTVVLNDWPSIKDALSQDSVLARHKDNIFNVFADENFISISGQQWKDQRRFALHQLRDLGFGKTSMEEHIIDEINHLCEELIDKSLGTDINVRDVLGISVSNNISSFLFGRRLDYNDKRKKIIDEMVKPDPSFSLTGFMAQFPVFGKYIINNLQYLSTKSFRETKDTIESLNEYFNNEFESHEKTLDSNDFRDYIDAFLTELKKANPKTSFNKKMLLGNIFNLFGAGTGTTTSLLEWALVVLATYPDIQTKLRTEIDDIIGRDKTPQYAHRNQMPYLQAFIHEIMRFRSIVTINLPRATSEDTVICGHQIAKGTQIFINLWAIDNDPKLWDNPQVFRPERFLKDNETVFFKPEHFIPFSYGKRSCPGEAMGTAEVFLYIASLVQRYDIKAIKNTNTTLDFDIYFAISPKQNPIVSFNKRF
ncbi:cytochrome P450 2J6-like [Oppia nitens]|uniref:cytochrome P450 2J6-like n=1 Tax=Oppia nitens TaxID=1686743 RepID=UPI0023DB660B|nr:cytochrome P450 2J6-like [Oppia nitens]